MPKTPAQFVMYLAGPMDGVPTQEAAGWREALATEFPQVLFFMPNCAYRNASKASAGTVDHLNRHVISCCSAVIANLTGPGRGFGTIREIEFARSQTRFVGVACRPDDDLALHSLMAHDLHLFDTPELAVQGALEFLTENRNKQQMNPMVQLLGLQPETDEEDE